MRRIVIFIGILLASAVAGGAFWWQYGEEQTASKPVTERAPLQQDVLVLEPLFVPVLQEGKVTHQLALTLTLAFADQNVKERALVLMPRLQDALLEELHSLYSLRRVRDSGFNSVLVRERLALASERVLGAGEIAALQLAVTEGPQSGANKAGI